MDVTTFVIVLTSIVVLEIFLGVFYIFKKSHKTINESEEEDLKKNSLLCRFVLDGAGSKIGESVAIDNDIMIVKKGTKYLGVPLKHIEEEEKTLLVKGLVDHDKAEEMGEQWRKSSFNEIKYSNERGKK